MAPKIHPNHPKNAKQHISLISEVVRPQRKKLSRYKLKKQAGIMQQILEDQQIL